MAFTKEAIVDDDDTAQAEAVLIAEQKYDLWVRMLTGQISVADASAEAGVDRSVITRIRAVARDGAITTLQRVEPMIKFAVKTAMIEPLDPHRRGQLDVFDVSP